MESSKLSKNTVPTEKQMKSLKRTLFYKVMLYKKVNIPFQYVSSNLMNILEDELKKDEGKCNKDGYVKPDSISIVSYSNGECIQNNICITITYTCLICNPVEGMKLRVRATNKTKAGIRAVLDDTVTPLDIFIARDHNVDHDEYNQLEENSVFAVEVIGQRFEINDKQISIIAKLTNKQSNQKKFIIDNKVVNIK